MGTLENKGAYPNSLTEDEVLYVDKLGGGPTEDGYVTLAQVKALLALSDSEIKTAYENNADTNAFTDTLSADLINHLANTADPHAVTKDQVGLSYVNNIKTNLVGTSDPDADNDTTEGYSLGSTWLNLATSNAFLCVSNLTAAAVWVETTNLTDFQAIHGIMNSSQNRRIARKLVI